MSIIHIMPEAAEMYNTAMAETEDVHAEDDHSAEEHSEEDHAGEESTSGATDSETGTEGAHSEETAGSDSHAGHSDLYPVPYLLYFLGYACILAIDRVLSSHFGHSHGHSHGPTVKTHKHVNGHCVETKKKPAVDTFER